MEQKKIYISGPISGYDYKERQQVFAKVQEVFELIGYEVKNPLANGMPPKRLYPSTHESRFKNVA